MARATRGAIEAAVLAGALELGGGLARADEATFKACAAKAVSTIDTVECQKSELASVERQLNAAYKAALATLPADQRAKLVAAERLWVTFRQADCEVFYGEETGTIASIQGGECMIGHARARIADLEAITTP